MHHTMFPMQPLTNSMAVTRPAQDTFAILVDQAAWSRPAHSREEPCASLFMDPDQACILTSSIAQRRQVLSSHCPCAHVLLAAECVKDCPRDGVSQVQRRRGTSLSHALRTVMVLVHTL
jgi:hypothetical protein